MLSIRDRLRHRDGVERSSRGGLLATLLLLDDDPILLCECGAGGNCGEDHAAVPA